MEIDWDNIASNLCACLGPQDGQPRCPCSMRFVKVIDGRYVSAQGEDLGPEVKVHRSHYEDMTPEVICHDLGHNPHPQNIQDIPLDKVLIHVCRSCGAEYRLMPNFLKEAFNLANIRT